MQKYAAVKELIIMELQVCQIIIPHPIHNPINIQYLGPIGCFQITWGSYFDIVAFNLSE